MLLCVKSGGSQSVGRSLVLVHCLLATRPWKWLASARMCAHALPTHASADMWVLMAPFAHVHGC